MATTEGQFTPSHEQAPQMTKRPDGDFETTTDISFQDENGKIWTAPTGTITDGASIPGVLAGFFGGKLSENHLHAAIIHDAYCAGANEGGPAYQIETWQDTHLMFYHACLVNGKAPTQAKLMYAGVRLGGPRWSLAGEPFTDLSRVAPERLQAEMNYCKNWIEAGGDSLSIEDVDQWMKDRESLLLKD